MRDLRHARAPCHRPHALRHMRENKLQSLTLKSTSVVLFNKKIAPLFNGYTVLTIFLSKTSRVDFSFLAVFLGPNSF